MRKLLVAVLLVSTCSGPVLAGDLRQAVSLNGIWQIAEGGMETPPVAFERTVPVPGLASQASPQFVDQPGPEVADRNAIRQKDLKREAFWYRRNFHFDGATPAVAILKVHKAMFGSQVILNGKLLGAHGPSFTPGYFDAVSALKSGDNELLIRVGADRDSVTTALPSGFDYEKTRYIPGIFDSVELICSGSPHFIQVQTAPDIAAKNVRVQALLRNNGTANKATVCFVVREAKSGREVGRISAETGMMANGVETNLDLRIPIADCRLWSPEDPFLYKLEADSGADSYQTRFGMREFRFDPASGRAMLNGKPYFMRGSNITLYRFFEDSACGALPWDKDWVTRLHQKVKDMHWNCLRYCIGFPPEAWYDIADELGILIQDEFPLWCGGPGWSKWPAELKSSQLAIEYAEWMRERWNHPCVVVWDASNETASPETAPAIQQVRSLDLSNRPWDNSYSQPLEPGDCFESHPYHFQNASFKLGNLAKSSVVPQGSAIHNDGSHAVIINEYGWLWLNRDGSPTTLTSNLYHNLLGDNSTTEQRRHLYATYTAAETEFWRHGRKQSAVMHFTALGYSRADGQTSDHWLDVAKLEWEPEFAKYVRDSFAPVSVMINAWADEYDAGVTSNFQISVINDLPDEWKGNVKLQLLQGEKVLQEKSQSCEVAGFGKGELSLEMTIPGQPGRYRFEATLLTPGSEPVHSVRDFSILAEQERQARAGLAAGKTVKASSCLTLDGSSYPACSVTDGRGDTRWSSEFSDSQWIAVDLGKSEKISRVLIDWESAFARSYTIEVSNDENAWIEVFKTDKGKGGSEEIKFAPVEARWVRLTGAQRATRFGYSMWEFRVFGN